MDPLDHVVTSAMAPATAPSTSKSISKRKINVSQIMDPLDETEAEITSTPNVDKGHRQLKAVKGDSPSEKAEPTPEQFCVFMV